MLTNSPISIKPGHLRRSTAFTLMEVMISVGLFSIVGMAILSSSIYLTRSARVATTYHAFRQDNRRLIDTFSKDVRMAQKIMEYDEDSYITFLVPTPKNAPYAGVPAEVLNYVQTRPTKYLKIQYIVDNTSKKLYRREYQSDSTTSFPASPAREKVLADNIYSLSFELYNRDKSTGDDVKTTTLSSAFEVLMSVVTEKDFHMSAKDGDGISGNDDDAGPSDETRIRAVLRNKKYDVD